MKISEINTAVKSVECAGEKYVNLLELDQLLKTNCRMELEDCLIVPYYIQNNSRLELYQYEFCCTSEFDFQQYVLRLTGKEKIEDIPEEILFLRRNCFSTCDEPDRLADYLEFLFGSKILKEEVERAFGGYLAENLYAAVY